jgi:RHS repeat-associated protein
LWKQRTPETNMTDYVYAYFANDTVQSVTDPRGVAVSYTYNNRNLPTVVDYSDATPDVNYSYGEYGERTLLQEKNGATVLASTTYAYNDPNMRTRLTGETRSFNGLGGTYQLGYSYNWLDEVTQVTYTAVNSLGTWSRSVNYGYNGLGAPTQIGTNLTAGNTADNVLKNLSFRAFGALKAADYGNTQHIELSYDADRLHLTRQQVYKAGPTPVYIVDKQYNYRDANTASNGRLLGLTDNIDGSFSTTYGYDAYNRLTSATSGSVLTRSYSYDAWGNLTGVTTGGTSNTLSSYTLNYANNATGAPATNRLSGIVEGPLNYAVSYDNAGNLTADNSTGATYTYDGASRLKTASTATSSYEYDGDGWRVKQTVGSTSTFYLWSSVFGQPVLELNGSGGVERAYVFSSAGQRVALQKGVSFYWVHTDHLGSSHKLTDTSGNVAYTAEYDPHGNLRFESGTTTLTTRKFTGYERDAANLDYAQARTYAYRRGRFVQPDPLGLVAGDLSNPQSLNLYSYVGNDPINAVDPNGMLLVPIYGRACAGTAGYEVCEWYVAGYIDIGGFGGGITGGPGIVEPRSGGEPQNGGGSDGTTAANNSIKQKICDAIPSGRTVGVSGGMGGVGSVIGGGEIVVNYNSGQVSAFGYSGVQVGWNGGVSGSVYGGYVYGLNNTNSNYSGGFTGGNGSIASVGGFVASSSGGLTGKFPRGQSPTGDVTAAGVSLGASLIPTPTGGVNATNYTKPLQLGKFWAFGPGDFFLYAARQLCK